MGKLVRDRIPEIMRADGKQPDTRVLGEQEYLASLFAKLLEESAELREAAPAQRVEEAADVYEVLLAVAAVSGFGLEEIQAEAARKRSTRGGFAARLWLERW